MGTNNEDRQDKGQFVQFPLHLIYERKDVSRDDKWVLLAIMGKCWSTGPHRLSYTDIAALADVPKSLLASFDDKKSGKHHEGIIDRLVRVTGYIRIVTGREINHTTGKLYKNAQSYIYIDYARIWQDNVQYCHAKKPKSDVFCVSEDDYQPVSNTNKVVSNTNNLDRDANEVVSIANEPVSNTNKVVSNLPSETTPYITEIDSDITDNREESNSAHTDADSFASAHSLDALSLSQSVDSDNHSHQSVTDVSYSTLATVSSAVTTRNEEGAPDHEPIVDSAHSLHSPARPLGTAHSQGQPQSTETLQTGTEGDGAPARRDVEIEGDTHAQPLQPLPTANHSDRGSGDVPSRDSQVNSTGFTSPLDTPPVGSAAGSDVVGGEGQGEVASRGGSAPGGTGTQGDTARGQVEGGSHDLVGMASPRHPRGLDNAAVPGGDSHDAAVDDRHVVAPEARPVLEAGKVEIDTLGRAWQHVDPEQIAPREDVPAVAVSLLTSSTVEPGESGEDTLPVAPVTGQEGKRTGKSRSKKDEPTRQQIDTVYAVFDELYQTVLEDLEFTCPHTPTSDKAIKELIKRKATPVRLRQVFMDMWGDQNEDGTYWWREHGRMTIKNVCNQYAPRIVTIQSRNKANLRLVPKPEPPTQRMPPRMPSDEELKRMVY